MDKAISLRISWQLSWLIVAGATAASAGGLLIPGLYRDIAFVRTAWLGNDLITLFVVVPVLAAALIFYQRGVQRALFIWLGLLGYMLYNYAFYLFGARFNEFFLLYVALFIVPVYTLILLLSTLDIESLGRQFSEKTPVRWISAALLFIAIPLSIVELGQTVHFIRTGVLPPTIVETGHPTSVVFALDLSLILPAMYLSAWLLWQRRAWGFLLSMFMLIKGFSYMLVLLLSSAFLAGFSLSGTWDPFTPFYCFVALVSAVCGTVLLRNFKT